MNRMSYANIGGGEEETSGRIMMREKKKIKNTFWQLETLGAYYVISQLDFFRFRFHDISRINLYYHYESSRRSTSLVLNFTPSARNNKINFL